MAFEPGGRADKLGNRYEGRVIVEYLFRLLQEDIYSIEVESIGGEEFGVDFWVKDLEDNRIAYQCKARNASKNFWDAGYLNSRGVFRKAKLHLDNGNNFVFVSAIPAPILNDLTSKARNSKDYKKFFKIQVSSIPEKKQLATFIRGLSFDPENESHKVTTYNYLKRIFIKQYPDDYDTKKRLLNRLNLVVTGDSEKVFHLLKDFIIEEDFLGKEVTSNIIWGYLKKKHHRAWDIGKDKKVIPKILEQNDSYRQSIKDQGLIRDKIFYRKEKRIAIDAILKNKIVFIHGSSGCGKSILLYDVFNELEKNNYLCFALRLDRTKFTGNTTKQLGEHFGLPTSPVHCLKVFGKNKLSVLFIDQLDAVRTNSHYGPQLLELTKKMIKEAIYTDQLDENIHIIISCKTFDFENDPEIRNWIENCRDILFEIKLNEFDESLVKEIIGKQYNNLSKKQQQLLKNPQNLKLWEKISSGIEDLSEIDSFKKLIEKVLNLIKRNIEKVDGITINEFNKLNSEIIEYMDKSGKLYIPSRKILSHSSDLINACISNGLIQKSTDDLYSYTHQSFIDYFIALNVMNKIDSGATLISWLGEKDKQLLVRRRQLEQVLFLLKEEDKLCFEELVIELIQSNDIRFLLKQVALGVLSKYKDFTDQLLECLLDKMNDPTYFKHIIFTVFWGKEYYVKKLIKKGIIEEWLEGGKEIKDITCNFLSAIAPSLSKEIYELLNKYIGKDLENNNIVLKSLPYDITHDSEDLFKLRMQLLKTGLYNQNIYYRFHELAEIKPGWCIEFIVLTLKSWKYNKDTQEIEKGYIGYDGYEEAEKKILSITEKISNRVWDEIVPQIERLTSNINKSVIPYSDWFENTIYKHFSFERLCIKLIELAAKYLGVNDPDAFFKRIKLIENSTNLIIKRIYWFSLQFIDIKYSDYCIERIITDFDLNNFYHDKKALIKILYILIESFSVFCSDRNFELIENLLLKYVETHNKKSFKRIFKYRIQGKIKYYHGELQYILLPSLSPERISQKTKNEIKVLQRKFGDGDPYQLLDFGNSSGMLSSKLSPNIEKISDKAWLNIILRGNNVNRGWETQIQSSQDEILESSVSQFANSFENISKKYPSRFINIALQFPENVHIQYINAIISAAIETKSNDMYGQEIKDTWEIIKVYDISKIIKRFLPTEEINTASSFVRLIRNRNNEDWDNGIIEILIEYSKGFIETENISDGNINPHDLNSKVINTVQCVAISALGSLLYDNKKYLPRFLEIIEKLIQQENILVRTALIDILIPLINYDKIKAVDLYLSIIRADYLIAATPSSIHFFNYTICEFHEKLGPVLYAMKDSQNIDVSKTGYMGIVGYQLFYNLFSDIPIEISCLNEKVKIELAGFLTDQINKDSYFDKSISLLEILFDDDKKEVRRSASRFLYLKIENQKNLQKLLKKFIISKAFGDEYYKLFRKLRDDYYESLYRFVDVIFSACDILLSKWNKEVEDNTRWEYLPDEIFPILIRLYDEGIDMDKSVFFKCLDFIDQFIYQRIGFEGLIKKIVDEM